MIETRSADHGGHEGLRTGRCHGRELLLRGGASAHNDTLRDVGTEDDDEDGTCSTQRPPTSKRPRAVRKAEYLYEAFLKVSVKTEPVALVCSFPLLMSRSPPFNTFSSVGPSNPR